jgi:hypothetical protein
MRRGTVGGFTVDGRAEEAKLCRQHADQALQVVKGRMCAIVPRPSVRAFIEGYPAITPRLA